MIPANGKMSLTKSRILRKKDSVREMWLSQRAKLTEMEKAMGTMLAAMMMEPPVTKYSVAPLLHSSL